MSYETTTKKGPVDTRDLREDRAQLLDTARELLDKSAPSATDVTTARRKAEEARALSLEIDRTEIRNDGLRDEYAASMGGGTTGGTGRYFRNVEDGKIIRAISHGESYRSAVNVPETSMSVGRLIRATASGDWRGAEAEHREYSQGTSAAGGYLLTPSMSARIIDLARAKSVLSAAGATTIPMMTEEMRVALVESDPVAHWTGENQEIEESSGTFGSIQLRARAIGVYVTASLELIRNVTDVESMIETTIAAALGLALDESALNGAGNNESPTGLLHSDRVSAYAVSAAISHDKLLKAARVLWNNNVEPQSMIFDGNLRCAIASLKDGDGNYSVGPAEISRLTGHMSTQVSSTDSNNTMYLGDFSNVVFGIRNQIEIEVSGVADDVFRKKQVAIRGLLFADFAVCRSNDVVKLTAISGTTS